MTIEEVLIEEPVIVGRTVEGAIVTEDVIEVVSIEEEDSELISEVGKDVEEEKVTEGSEVLELQLQNPKE